MLWPPIHIILTPTMKTLITVQTTDKEDSTPDESETQGSDTIRTCAPLSVVPTGLRLRPSVHSDPSLVNSIVAPETSSFKHVHLLAIQSQ
jgi:hypothetical protein